MCSHYLIVDDFFLFTNIPSYKVKDNSWTIKYCSNEFLDNILKLNNTNIKKEFININQSLLKTNNIKEFEKYLSRHEFLISNLIGLKPVKEKLFKDYEKGIVKSLGAWGGDFILVTKSGDTVKYFKEMGYTTIIPWKEMGLVI